MAGPRKPFVLLILIACAAGAGLCIVQNRAAPQRVELRVRELVRVQGGQPVLVLQEAGEGRWLPLPVSRGEAAVIDRELHRPGGLASEAVESLGGRVLNATIDEVSNDRGFRAHLSVGAGMREVRLDAAVGEAVGLALQAGAPIVVDRAVLDAVGIAPGDLHRKVVRGLRSSRTPAPVLRI